ncbi:hypothetical protein EDC94DRAFT_652249 [Helicostylum pulchrum]|nr:hypothetical protein EDC94DRAFT_652249 [Helicostylum pulchrum]
MTTINQILNEVLLQIFRSLPPNNQLVCASVCRNWRTLARGVYFSEINIIPDTRVVRLGYCLQRTGGFVRSLTIAAIPSIRPETIIRLIRSCLSLFELELASVYCRRFCESGLTLDKLKSVSVHPVSRNHHMSIFHSLYRIAYRHRRSFEKLYISFTNDVVLQQEFGGVMNYLSQFENLGHLTLDNGDGTAPTVYFDTLLNTCRTLEELYIGYSYPLYSPAMVQVGRRTSYPSMRRLELLYFYFLGVILNVEDFQSEIRNSLYYQTLVLILRRRHVVYITIQWNYGVYTRYGVSTDGCLYGVLLIYGGLLLALIC